VRGGKEGRKRMEGGREMKENKGREKKGRLGIREGVRDTTWL